MKPWGSGEAILELPRVTESSRGNYTCIAHNIHGNASQTFFVDVEEIENGLNYGLVIGIPILVFIVAVAGSYVYFKFIKKEKASFHHHYITGFAEMVSMFQFYYRPA